MERKELISPSWHVNLSVIESFKSFPYFLSVKYFFVSSPLPPTQFALGDSSKRCYSNFCLKGKAAKKNKGTEGTWSKPGTCCCLSLKYFSFSVFECGGRKRSDVNGGGVGNKSVRVQKLAFTFIWAHLLPFYTVPGKKNRTESFKRQGLASAYSTLHLPYSQRPPACCNGGWLHLLCMINGLLEILTFFIP